jgi:hypothetical protein
MGLVLLLLFAAVSLAAKDDFNSPSYSCYRGGKDVISSVKDLSEIHKPQV